MMFKIEKGMATRAELPAELQGLSLADLADLSWAYDANPHLRGIAYWPEAEPYDEPLQEGEAYGAEVFLLDPERCVVIVSHNIIKVPVNLEAIKAQLIEDLESAVENRIQKSTRWSLAYLARENAARNFKAAGYQGEPTTWITRFADNAKMTYPAATDLIIQQADGLKFALHELDNLRMDKYLIKAATTTEEARGIQQDILNQIAAVIIP